MLTVHIQRETASDSPSDDDLRSAIELALSAGAAHGAGEHAVENRAVDSVINAAEASEQGELSLRLVDEDEMQTLNGRFRDKHKVTNVLSFPAEPVPGLPPGAAPALLGDIVICAPVVAAEAREQNKHLAAHWDHLVIHGVLHILGFDHQTDADANVMESLETRLLAERGWACPYTDSAHDDRTASTLAGAAL